MDGFYCNFTSYIHADNRDTVAEALIEVLVKEPDCYLLPQLPDLKFDLEQLSHLRIGERPPLLIVGLGIGRSGWTVVKTYPNEWLFLRAPGTDHPRLSTLAMQLGCEAFFYRVMHDEDGVLLEVDRTGNFRFDTSFEPQFSLIEVPGSFQVAIRVNQQPEIYEFAEGDAERIDIALAKTIDLYQGRWYCYDLFKEVYSNWKELEQTNIKLLGFQLPNNYLKTLPKYTPEYNEDDEPF
ncbi:hypothetical protein [Gloeothece verrucosa]|uniref:Uncharacterized protein n=1 Tax=Gloeothece verrucosa (strain PCC 7822) TaxID=497965 RepID=E0UH00_GLOV7|nr:hypothetical protein [Gloeothece verrucosa]ADN15599.1 hypothetical protein Cyan7822_3662 [Gloeothece verrucosa PCC 7822]